MEDIFPIFYECINNSLNKSEIEFLGNNIYDLMNIIYKKRTYVVIHILNIFKPIILPYKMYYLLSKIYFIVF